MVGGQWPLELGDGGALHLRQRERGGVGDQDLVLRADVTLDFVGEIALDLGGEWVSGAEIAENVDVARSLDFQRGPSRGGGEGEEGAGSVCWGSSGERKEGGERAVWGGRGTHGSEGLKAGFSVFLSFVVMLSHLFALSCTNH